MIARDARQFEPAATRVQQPQRAAVEDLVESAGGRKARKRPDRPARPVAAVGRAFEAGRSELLPLEHSLPVVHVAADDAWAAVAGSVQTSRTEQSLELSASQTGGETQMHVENVDVHGAPCAHEVYAGVLCAARLSPADRQVDVALASDRKARQRRVPVAALFQVYVHSHRAIAILELPRQVGREVEMVRARRVTVDFLQ